MLHAVVLALVQQSAPAATLPPPTGHHSVVTREFRWTDTNRADSILQPPAPREIVVRLWQPATALRQPPPVIVFATGRAMGAQDYSALAQELASRAFVIAVVESPHQSRTTLADGTNVPTTRWRPSRDMLEQFDRADAFFEEMNSVVSADLRFAVARLAELAASDGPLRGALDLGRLGMAGHSNGAMAASRACATEPLCRAFLGIEGTQAREIRQRGVTKPYGLLISEASLGFDREGVYRELGAHARGQFTVLRVNGAGHNSVTDLAVLRPELFSYQVTPLRGLDISRRVVAAFFEQYLRDGPRMDTALSDLGEITIERYRPENE